jgi:hypothetical protein
MYSVASWKIKDRDINKYEKGVREKETYYGKKRKRIIGWKKVNRLAC